MPSSNERNNNYDKDKTRTYKVQNGKRRKKKSRRIKDDEKTRRVKTRKKPQVQDKKGKKGKKQKKHPKLMLALKIGVIIFLLLCVIGAGIVAGVFFGLFGDEFEITKQDLEIRVSNSVVVDANGNVIADLSGDEKRQIVTLEEMSDYLPKAYVAIEDERFYQHSGVDFKRTAGAIVQTLLGNSSYGGSTITQQLVKNITKEKDNNGIKGIIRKVKEWAKAYQVERMISKDQILELYLNILFVGSNNLHGVELGAQYYFNKSAKDLDLAECAFMAGINTSPTYYNPYELLVEGDTEEKRDARIKNRSETVLDKMIELGYINQEEYDTALAKIKAGLPFSKGAQQVSNYSYHTDAVISQVIEQVMEERGVERQIAENYVYSSGLKIYSTVDKNIQARLDEEYAKSKYVITSPSKKQKSQSGMAVVDYKTGNVLGVAGGFGEKTITGWNRATQMKKQTGSSMKPIATIAPGLEEKVITAATVYDDAETDFGNYVPHNYNSFRGPINIRSFIETSQNIPAIKIMKELTPKKSLEYLRNMGVTSLKNRTSTSDEDEVLSLAIGGMKNGISPLEMAVAYGTIANGGVCVSPTFYTKVEDASGNVVLTPKQTQTRAISEQNAYIATTIIQEPVNGSSGTARSCKIPGMDTAAKTGTTDNSVDRWLCGFTPYYSAATWFGYDDSETVNYSGNPAGLIWTAVMKDIHKGLPNATFKRPSGIVEQTVCRTTGCLATTGCANTYKEIFTADNLPQTCEGHGAQTICSESGLVATQYCAQYVATRVNNYGAVIPKEQLKLWKPLGGSSTSGTKINEVCGIHTKPKEQPPTTPTTPTNTTNNTANNNKVNQNNTTTNQNKVGNETPEPPKQNETEKNTTENNTEQ